MKDDRQAPAGGRRRVRWWPAALVLALVSVRLAVIWLGEAPHTQARVVSTLGVAVVGSTLLLLWALLFSRLPGRTRAMILLAVVGLAALALSTLRVTGVSGNAVPILAWRWSGRPAFGPAEGRAAAVAPPGAADYPQLYGPHRDATLAGPRLAREWRSTAPRELWRHPVGEAWSSFAVVGAAAVTQEQRGEDEAVVRYDLATGRQLWVHRDRAALVTVVGGRGPRATPTIADGRVYTLGATGILNVLELDTGRPVWSRNLFADHLGKVADYGMPSSPLLVDDLVVVLRAMNTRPSLVAYRQADGAPAWEGGDELGSYSSPILATVGGVRQIVFTNQRSVAGHDPATGARLWQTPWSVPGEKITPPLPLGDDRLLVSAGYGAGSRLLRLRATVAGLEAEELWASPRLKSKFASMALRDGVVYGLDDGVLTALDVDTGARLWKAGRYGHGQLILVGDLLLVQAEQGDVVLVEATPLEHRELGRLAALDGKTWNPPALAGRYLLVRNNREAACYELPVE